MIRPFSLAIVLAATLLAASSPARAEVDSLEVFALIPTLNQGRVMPLDTFARSTLLACSGRSTFNRGPASHWLARALFTPEATQDDKIFLVNNPEVIEALGLPPAKGRERYSYTQLQPTLTTLHRLVRAAFKLEQNQRSPVDQELIQLYHGVTEYASLTGEFTFTIPQADFTITDAALKADLDLPPEPTTFSFMQMVERTDTLRALWKRQEALPQDQWTPYQNTVAELLEKLAVWGQSRRQTRLNIVPAPASLGDNLWITPWQALSMGPDGPLVDQVAQLNNMAMAYRAGEQVAFDLAARTFLSQSIDQAPDPESVRHLKLEVRYNKSKAFYRAELLYGFGFLLVLFSVMFPNRKSLYRAGAALVILALVPHTFGIVARMVMMGRPPVTNLYSTFIFVGWCSAVMGMALEYVQRNRLGLLTASVSGLALLLTSGRFGADGDTMGVMVAVLDSNFWLATHVVCITVGYAGCCVAGLLGHIYLLQALRRTPDDPGLKETYSAVYGALAFGLIFSFLGTMLGGVWADQSWGRFWGWDPKENGALVIVLWSAIIFHAKIGRMIGPAGFAGGCVLGVIWVLLAWLGVNLLGVGLHSYGFTSGIARGLLIACTVEAVFVAATLPFVKKAAAPPP